MGSLEAAAQDRAKWKQFVGGLWSDKGLSQVKAGGRHNMPRPSPPSVEPTAPAEYRAQHSSRFPRPIRYVPTLTAAAV